MVDGFADEGLAEVWTPVALSREVGRKPLSLSLASERVVLFRNGEGQVSALLDRCPHRGVALSLGKVGKDGCLECPFHGWRFAGDGACTHVPLNPMPPEKRQRLAATAFPVRERGGLIWLYTRPGAEAPSEPFVPDALEDPKRNVWMTVMPFKAHWTRVMENMLDMPHLPFVHRRTIGAGMRRELTPDTRMELAVEPSPTGFHMKARLDHVASGASVGEERTGTLDWLRPNGMQLTGRIFGGEMRSYAFCVPESYESTRLFVISTRDFLRYNPLGWIFDQFNRVIAGEDKAVVESSQPWEVPEPSEEKSVATDRATLAFRRWYLEQKRAETRAARSPAPEAAPREASVPAPAPAPEPLPVDAAAALASGGPPRGAREPSVQ